MGAIKTFLLFNSQLFSPEQMTIKEIPTLPQEPTAPFIRKRLKSLRSLPRPLSNFILRFLQAFLLHSHRQIYLFQVLVRKTSSLLLTKLLRSHHRSINLTHRRQLTRLPDPFVLNATTLQKKLKELSCNRR